MSEVGPRSRTKKKVPRALVKTPGHSNLLYPHGLPEWLRKEFMMAPPSRPTPSRSGILAWRSLGAHSAGSPYLHYLAVPSGLRSCCSFTAGFPHPSSGLLRHGLVATEETRNLSLKNCPDFRGVYHQSCTATGGGGDLCFRFHRSFTVSFHTSRPASHSCCNARTQISMDSIYHPPYFVNSPQNGEKYTRFS